MFENEDCCDQHLDDGCWYDPCCVNCPWYLCRAIRSDTGQHCTLKPHTNSTKLEDHTWSKILGVIIDVRE